jgi:hypothetical protein
MSCAACWAAGGGAELGQGELEHAGDADRILQHAAVHGEKLNVARLDVPEPLHVPEHG